MWTGGKKTVKRIAFIAVLCAFVAVPAFADLSPIGDPVEVGSWARRFQEDGWYGVHYNFDLLAVRVVWGPPLGHDAYSSFSVSGWDQVYENPAGTLASAGGPAVGYLQWNFLFSGSMLTPFRLDYAAFAGDMLIGTGGIQWSGTAFTYPSTNWAPTRAEVAPVPAAVLLGMLGLSVAGLKLRKFA
jgi:hypothetical protein